MPDLISVRRDVFFPSSTKIRSFFSGKTFYRVERLRIENDAIERDALQIFQTIDPRIRRENRPWIDLFALGVSQAGKGQQNIFLHLLRN